MRPTGAVSLRLGMAAALVVTASLIGCRSKVETGPADSGKYRRIELTSTAFAQGQPIPRKYTGEGANVSPPLSWSALPQGTKELVLICDDPDAPGGTWVHWVVYKVPAAATGLPEDVGGADGRQPELSSMVEGRNSFGETGYGGPMPPPGHGKHRYFFRLYALDSELALEPGLDKVAILEAIVGHIVAEGELMGTYER
jgi:Raf kinase inhibitor-like YbhB/YbcL family protein